MIPDEFSGILAGAPAINWAKFLVQEAWGYVVASEYGSCNHRPTSSNVHVPLFFFCLIVFWPGC